MAVTFLYILSWACLGLQFCFAVLSIAAGLYYVAELIEEYSVKAKRVMYILLWTVVVIHLALWVIDGLPLMMIFLGIATHICFSFLLRTFPFISILSPSFILGCTLLLASHVYAFMHFSEKYYPFTEILAYFTLCLWIVPFSFFLSLSANDNVLPIIGSGGVVALDDSQLKISRRSGFLRMTDWLKEVLGSDGRSSKSI